MTMSWSETKTKMEAMLSSDPQRATLALRAMRGVEEGLQFMTQQGYSFELAPRGTYAELRGQGHVSVQSLLSRTLSVAEAMEHVQPGIVESAGSEVFDAK